MTDPKADTTVLYRPVGPQELELIVESGWRSFPSRLPEQPIFYPVLNRGYADQIARDWNSASERTGYRGYVTEFEVLARFVRRYEPRQVGTAEHLELWVPSEDLAEFNRHIVGPIRVVAAFHRGKDDPIPNSTSQGA